MGIRLKEEVILVDEENNIVGQMDKMQAHLQNKRHRAFSVFLFHASGQMLLQQRSDSKYHSAGLWSNACCSHPHTGKDCGEQAHERLRYEMGIDCPLKDCGLFSYQAELMNGMYENEIDRIYIGSCNEKPQPNPLEVKSFRYASIESLRKDIAAFPENYTVWFRMLFDFACEKFL